MAAALCFSLAGCMGDSDFSFSATDPSGSGESPAAPAASYVRKDYDADKYPYFAMLNETEKNAYSLICENLTMGNKEFECLVSIKADQDTRMGIITDVKQELRRCSALKIMYGATKGGKVK